VGRLIRIFSCFSEMLFWNFAVIREERGYNALVEAGVHQACVPLECFLLPLQSDPQLRLRDWALLRLEDLRDIGALYVRFESFTLLSSKQSCTISRSLNVLSSESA